MRTHHWATAILVAVCALLPNLARAQTTALSFPSPLCHADQPDLLLFIHGWNGDPAFSWREFPRLVCSDPELTGATVLSLGYPTFLVQRNLSIEQLAHWINERLLANHLEKFK